MGFIQYGTRNIPGRRVRSRRWGTLVEAHPMADKDSKRETNADPAPGPGDPEWERNREVIHGEVDARDPSKGTGPVTHDDEDEAKK